MDWDIYEEMQDKIDALYADDETLVAALSGGLWTPAAPPDNDYPYALYFIVAMTPERWNSTTNPQDVVVQFTFYSEAHKRTELTETILPAFQSAFDAGGDGVSGTYASYSFEVSQIRGPFVEPGDPEVMRLDIDYDVQVIPVS